jgi:Protein of unknown function (DUF3499)
VIYHRGVRRCAKTRCERSPSATASLLYGAREVCLVDLIREPDPRFVDLCEDHIARLVPPVGWVVRDDRTDPAADASNAPRGMEPIRQ